LLSVQLRFVLRRLHAQRRPGSHTGVAGELLRRLHRMHECRCGRARVVLRPQYPRRENPFAQPEPASVLRPRRCVAQRPVSGDTKMHTYIRILVLAAALHAGTSIAANLLVPGAQDQVPAALTHAQASGAAGLDRTPVRVSHALDAAQAIDSAPKPFVAQSREFWSDVGATELRTGVKLHTTAPGALIRLSPQGGASAALDPAG